MPSQARSSAYARNPFLGAVQHVLYDGVKQESVSSGGVADVRSSSGSGLCSGSFSSSGSGGVGFGSGFGVCFGARPRNNI